MSALTLWLSSRCEHDSLPGFCTHWDCDNWDWRMPDDTEIDGPLGLEKASQVMGVSREWLRQWEREPMRKFFEGMGSDGISWRYLHHVPKPENIGHDPDIARANLEKARASGKTKKGARCKHCGERLWRMGREVHRCKVRAA